MELVITETNYEGMPAKVHSADGRYEWFHGSDGYIFDSAAKRSIYQMSYMRRDEFGSDPLPADVEADARAFWNALRAAQKVARAAADAARLKTLVDEAKTYRRSRSEMENDLIDAEDAWITGGRKGPAPRLGDTDGDVVRRSAKQR